MRIFLGLSQGLYSITKPCYFIGFRYSMWPSLAAMERQQNSRQVQGLVKRSLPKTPQDILHVEHPNPQEPAAKWCFSMKGKCPL